MTVSTLHFKAKYLVLQERWLPISMAVAEAEFLPTALGAKLQLPLVCINSHQEIAEEAIEVVAMAFKVIILVVITITITMPIIIVIVEQKQSIHKITIKEITSRWMKNSLIGTTKN